MLSQDLAIDEFYEVSEKIDDYGAVSTIKKLKKQALCDAVCSAEADLPLTFNERMSSFDPIVEIVLSVFNES